MPEQLPGAVPPPDPYEVLNLSPGADNDTVKAAYFKLVRAHPPERDPERFKSIRAAYEALNTPTKRLDTDMLRVQSWPEPALPAASTITYEVAAEDILLAAGAFTDLGRTDWSADYREVKL